MINEVTSFNVLFTSTQPIAMIRATWKQRGPLFTEYGVSVRCVPRDQTGSTNNLHYLTDGSMTLAFIHLKEQFFVPLALVLKVILKRIESFAEIFLLNFLTAMKICLFFFFLFF